MIGLLPTAAFGLIVALVGVTGSIAIIASALLARS
jgi:hypothetical protein